MRFKTENCKFAYSKIYIVCIDRFVVGYIKDLSFI